MLSKHVVIQKLCPPNKVIQYQASDNALIWSFEHRRQATSRDNKDVFPFVFENNLRFRKITQGAETKLAYREGKEIIFSEDYGVPGGFVIGVLFPENYAPFILKFKEKPFIPTGIHGRNVSISPPGHFQIYYNRITRQSAIAFLITSDSFFGFKAVMKPVEGDFPLNEHFWVDDPFAHSLTNEVAPPRPLERKDIENLLIHSLENSTLDEILGSLNELRVSDHRVPTLHAPVSIQAMSGRWSLK
jgi:hypothetical protein